MEVGMLPTSCRGGRLCPPTAPQARDVFSYSPQCRYDCATATVAPRAFVLASSISLAPPQAAGLVHSAARPLQTANATLVCCLVPFLSCQKKVCKKEALENEITLTREKACRSVVRVIVSLSVVRTPFGRPSNRVSASHDTPCRIAMLVPVEYLTYGSRKRRRVFRLPRRSV